MDSTERRIGERRERRGRHIPFLFLFFPRVVFARESRDDGHSGCRSSDGTGNNRLRIDEADNARAGQSSGDVSDAAIAAAG